MVEYCLKDVLHILKIKNQKGFICHMTLRTANDS